MATVQRFCEEGAQVCVLDRAPYENTQLSHEFGERITYIQGDLNDSACLQVVDSHFANTGVDVLVNNAGIIRDASIGKMSLEDWNQVLAVNLTAVFQMSQKAAVVMREQGSGVILNAASVVAHYGNFGQANYVATKAGVIGFTKTLSKELGRFNIRVNAVAPGFIATPMVQSIPCDVQKKMCDKTPLKRLGRPQEVAALYAFLASDDAAYITGSVVNIDGGLVIG